METAVVSECVGGRPAQSVVEVDVPLGVARIGGADFLGRSLLVLRGWGSCRGPADHFEIWALLPEQRDLSSRYGRAVDVDAPERGEII